MFDNMDEQYQQAVDTLDVKYIDGVAYMSVHTVDTINHALASVLDLAEEIPEMKEVMSDELIKGAVWVMTVWSRVHDELSIRAESATLPDTPESLTD